MPLRAGNAIGPQIPGANLGRAGDQADEHEIDLPAKHVGQRWRRSLVGNVEQADSRHQFELLAGQVKRRSQAAERDRQLAGLGFGEFKQGLEIVRGQSWIANQQAWHRCDHRDRREVGHRIEWQLGVQRGIDGVAGEAHQQRVAVGSGLRDCIGSQIAAGAGAVFHQHRLLERRGQQFCDGSRQRVRGAARRRADQHFDRPRRVFVGAWRLVSPHDHERGNGGQSDGVTPVPALRWTTSHRQDPPLRRKTTPRVHIAFPASPALAFRAAR